MIHIVAWLIIIVCSLRKLLSMSVKKPYSQLKVIISVKLPIKGVKLLIPSPPPTCQNQLDKPVRVEQLQMCREGRALFMWAVFHPHIQLCVSISHVPIWFLCVWILSLIKYQKNSKFNFFLSAPVSWVLKESYIWHHYKGPSNYWTL